MKFSTALLTATIAALASAEALPWAEANAQAKAAAEAYAVALADAQAIGHPDPEAYAMAASADDCATVACHSACGMMIIAGQACSTNTEDSYTGPYSDGCLCSSADSEFLSTYAACMDCGWTLWKYYSPYLSEALAQCNAENGDYSTEPTGTARCSTTLTDVYTKDPNIDYTTLI